MIVAIDGPAASGKSTVAQGVARRLGFGYLDTGAMYRAVAWRALREGIDLADEGALTALAGRTAIAFRAAEGEALATRVLADGDDVTVAVRTPEVNEAVSVVAKVPGVREAMVGRQRELARGGDVVVEGRDIGTVVFPDAELKVFLDASPDERARRRHSELTDAGHELVHEEVASQLTRRDRIDSSRDASPLVFPPPGDAVRLDTTALTPDEVVERVIALAEGRRA